MARQEPAFARGVARGVAAFRGAALAWAGIGLVLQRDDLTHRWVAIGSLGAAGLVTAAATVVATRRGAIDRRVLAIEVAVGLSLLVLDGVVFEATREQSLAWAWPAAGIISVAVVAGLWAGLSVAALAALASFAGESILRGGADWSVSAASKSALYALAAFVAAAAADRLREAEAQISMARAREEVARTLHDGVLQTLAAIQRRSDDAELRSLALDQERELRSFLFGRDRVPTDIAIALRDACEHVARRHGLRPQVVLADDLPRLDVPVIAALVGAVQEALTNAAKHSNASNIVIYAEPDDDDGGVQCSVRDNGVGFDEGSVQMGEGMNRSIRARLAEVGGSVEIESSVGHGTEVRMWVP